MIPPRIRFAMRPLPWLAIAGDGTARLALGPRWGGLRLLAVGPAIASAADGVLVTVAAGMASLAVYLAFALTVRPVVRAPGSRSDVMTEAVIAGVTAACGLASMMRRRREAELSQAREIADITQRVLLRPVPRRAGPVRLAAWYRSASTGARVGGDLFEVVSTPGHVRLVIGDVEGKGLPALQAAATVLGLFREAAHQEDSLGAITGRIEASLARQFNDEQFATAILAQVSPDGGQVELLNCGHPPPLLLGPARPRCIDTGTAGLPLGLGALGGAEQDRRLLPAGRQRHPARPARPGYLDRPAQQRSDPACRPCPRRRRGTAADRPAPAPAARHRDSPPPRAVITDRSGGGQPWGQPSQSGCGDVPRGRREVRGMRGYR